MMPDEFEKHGLHEREQGRHRKVQNERGHGDVERPQPERQQRDDEADDAAGDRRGGKRNRKRHVVGALQEAGGEGADPEKSRLPERDQACIAGEDIERYRADHGDQAAIGEVNPEHRKKARQSQQRETSEHHRQPLCPAPAQRECPRDADRQ